MQTQNTTDTQNAISKYQTFQAFMLGEFRDDEYDQLADIARHGANTGYAHLTYTRDIADVYAAFTADIWAIVADYADEIGESVADMLARNSSPISTADDLAQFMVWAAAEIFAQQFTDEN